jgi:hypothetical protein
MFRWSERFSFDFGVIVAISSASDRPKSCDDARLVTSTSKQFRRLEQSRRLLPWKNLQGWNTLVRVWNVLDRASTSSAHLRSTPRKCSGFLRRMPRWTREHQRIHPREERSQVRLTHACVVGGESLCEPTGRRGIMRFAHRTLRG